MAGLLPLEKHMLRGTAGPITPPVFVLGSPRSGTTLSFQVLTHSLRFAYISNLAHRLYRTPVVATLIGKRAIVNFDHSFRSRYGHIGGWGAPNEGGWVWNRWLHGDDCQNETTISDNAKVEIYSTIAGISRVLDAPFISKNTVHSVQVRLLSNIFPGCCFLMILREPLYTIQSLIKAREDRLRNQGIPLDTWYSVKPREVETLYGYDYIEQICRQVHSIEIDAFQDIVTIARDHCLVVDYEDLCEQPARIISEVRHFLKNRNITTLRYHKSPAAFPVSRRLRLAGKARRRVEFLIAELWGDKDPWRRDPAIKGIRLARSDRVLCQRRGKP